MSSKKKLLYITRYSLDTPFNLQRKFDGQLAAFANIGLDVYFIGYDRTNLYLINGENKIVYGKTHFAVPSYLHTQFYNDLHKAAVKAIKEVGFDYPLRCSAQAARSPRRQKSPVRPLSWKYLHFRPIRKPS